MASARDLPWAMPEALRPARRAVGRACRRGWRRCAGCSSSARCRLVLVGLAALAAVVWRTGLARRRRGPGRRSRCVWGWVVGRALGALLGLRRARRRPAGHPRRPVPPARRRALRPDAVRRRHRRPAGPPVRPGHRAAAHRGGRTPTRRSPAWCPPRRPGCGTGWRPGARPAGGALTDRTAGAEAGTAVAPAGVATASTGCTRSRPCARGRSSRPRRRPAGRRAERPGRRCCGQRGREHPAGRSARVRRLASSWSGCSGFSWRLTRYRVDGEDLRAGDRRAVGGPRRVRLDRLQAVDVVRPLVARQLRAGRAAARGGRRASRGAARLPVRGRRRSGCATELLARAAGLHYETPTGGPRGGAARRCRSAGRARAARAGGRSPVIVRAACSSSSGSWRRVWRCSASRPSRSASCRSPGGASRAPSASPCRVARRPPAAARAARDRAQTVPPGRVQAVRIVEPLLWRSQGWCRVEVDVAGYGGRGGQPAARENELLPVGHARARRMAAARARRARPRRRAAARTRSPSSLAGLAGYQPDPTAISSAPPPARWVDPIAWRRHRRAGDARGAARAGAAGSVASSTSCPHAAHAELWR